MSAEDRIRSFKSDSGGEGTCPICHSQRTRNGCRTWWDVELKDGKWRGTLYATCASFRDDRAELCEALNRYHVRDAEPTDG